MLLINIDGADGTGKSTLVEGIIKHYKYKGYLLNFVHFPRYETEIGKVIQKVLNKEIQMHPSALQMLYSSDRLNWYTYDYPELEDKYDIVLVDRYLTSGMVYGEIDGLDPNEILYNDRRTKMPDLHIILYADADVVVKRIDQRQEAKGMYETLSIVKQANNKYKRLQDYLDDVEYIDSALSKDEVLKEAVRIIDWKLREVEGYE
jgi:dTMP kinase